MQKTSLGEAIVMCVCVPKLKRGTVEKKMRRKRKEKCVEKKEKELKNKWE